MITVSLCMIVKNEEDTIGRCLKSVAELMDEIIIVDTGSTDRTKEIVKEFTDHIYDFQWIDDFAAARNTAFSHATKEYILWLDADDMLKEADQKKFSHLKKTLDPSVDSVTMNYHLAFDEFGNVTTSLKRNRLVKREKNFIWIGAVHEYLEVWGNIYHSDIAVTHGSIHHDSDRNLRIYENRLTRGEEFSPRDLYYFANELKDHQMYERAIEYYEKFLDTGKGWIEDNIGACGKIADCYHSLGNTHQELLAAFRSFEFDTPRAEFCCRLGFHFLQIKNIPTAIFWYKLATQLECPDSMAIANLTCSTWLPHLQLCLCYDSLGKYELANKHNEIALSYRPKDPRMLHNQKYFEKILGKTKKNKKHKH